MTFDIIGKTSENIVEDVVVPMARQKVLQICYESNRRRSGH